MASISTTSTFAALANLTAVYYALKHPYKKNVDRQTGMFHSEQTGAWLKKSLFGADCLGNSRYTKVHVSFDARVELDYKKWWWRFGLANRIV